MAGVTDEREAEGFFLDVPEKLNDPFPDLAYFRENRPVFYHEALDQWFVFGYDDVSAMFSDPRMSADRMKGFVDAAPEEVREDLRSVAPYLERFVLMMDEPDHGRVRRFLHHGFNAAAIRGLQARIQQIADELLDRMQSRGRMDASGDYGFLLPAYVLSDFLGFPKEDRDRVFKWSVDFIGFFNVVPITAGTTRPMVQSASEMIRYVGELLAERRREPRDDFLGALANADAGEISEEEIVANAMLLLLAGHVAPRNLIGNAVYLLLKHPDQLAKLREDPSLMRNVLEETLRFEPPVTLIPRIALEDLRSAREQDPGGTDRPTQHRLGEPRRGALPRPRPLRRHARAGQDLELRARPARLPRRAAGVGGGPDLPGNPVPAHARRETR